MKEKINGVIDLGGGIYPYDKCNFRIVIDIDTEEGELDDGIPTVFIEHDLTRPLTKDITETIRKYSDRIELINISLLLSQLSNSFNEIFSKEDSSILSLNYISKINTFTENVITLLDICKNCRMIRIVDNLFDIATFLELLILKSILSRKRKIKVSSLDLINSYVQLEERIPGDFEVILKIALLKS